MHPPAEVEFGEVGADIMLIGKFPAACGTDTESPGLRIGNGSHGKEGDCDCKNLFHVF